MTDTVMDDIEAIARRHGLTLAELRAVLVDTDASRGRLGPADVEAGLQQVLATYVGALASTAERIANPAERLVVDRFLSLAMETLAGQLEGSSHPRN